ncbi:MAG: GntR family transcriptional regulator [Gemmatimonadota bacterium]
MGKDQSAGAIVLDVLRDRIISGLYLGHWHPGDRLPSIREIADAEGVDRKTAAAAYRRLEGEGLVEVKPRSGVYLRHAPTTAPPGPIERLHRRWLEHTYSGARELGLDTGAILHLIRSVADVERLRVPVVECNWAQAESIAAELRDRLDIQAVPYLIEDLRPDDPVLTEVPVLVSTPYHRGDLDLLAATDRLMIEVTTPAGVLQSLRRSLAGGHGAVVLAANHALARKIGRALRHMSLIGRNGEPHTIIAVDACGDVAEAIGEARRVFIWPGTPGWVDDALPSDIEAIRPRRALSDTSIGRVQTAILEAAVRRAGAVDARERVRAISR